MTERNKCDCYISGVTAERKALFKEIFEDGHVPITCPIVQGRLTHEQLKEATPFFMVALDRITPEQRQRLVKQLARRFNLSEGEVEKDLDKVGCPIRWDTEVALAICDLHIRCMI